MLQLNSISFHADSDDGKPEIIRNISLKLEKNKFIVITGPNGGGKSTLAKIIAGIIPATSGSIVFQGEDISDLSITDRAKCGIGFAFQQPVRFKGMTVLDLLRIASGKQITIAEACEFLSEVGLCAKDYIHREINASLSGGELKRIEIATILARDVQLAIFDEPEAGIDLWSFQNLIRIFEKMRETSQDRTILVISHQERILNIADEIIVLANGVIEKQGSKDEILPTIIGTKYAADVCRKLS